MLLRKLSLFIDRLEVESEISDIRNSLYVCRFRKHHYNAPFSSEDELMMVRSLAAATEEKLVLDKELKQVRHELDLIDPVLFQDLFIDVAKHTLPEEDFNKIHAAAMRRLERYKFSKAYLRHTPYKEAFLASQGKKDERFQEEP